MMGYQTPVKRRQERFSLSTEQFDLVRQKDGKWFLLGAVDALEKTLIRATDFIGVDLEVMNIATDGGGDEVSQAAETMMRDGLRRVPATHDGKLVGIISRSDIIHLIAPS
jgi:CBS domain-containing protein